VIKIQYDSEIEYHLTLGSTLMLIEDEDYENFGDIEKYWTYRANKCNPVTYNGLYLDSRIIDYHYSLKSIARSLTANVLLRHGLYVITEDELNTLKILKELVN